ncbi:MAG: NUDIX hydrolase [Flavobacteriales bacterium]
MSKNTENLLDLSVDCVVFGFDNEKLKLLVIEQERVSENKPPRKALPGDLVFESESLDNAATRVLKELTGLNGIYLRQFYTFGNPERMRNLKDQDWFRKFRQHPNSRVISVAYYSLVKMEDYHLSPSSFAENAEWINIDEIPQLAFDHNEIVNRALGKLRKDTQNYNISFKLLPNKFTLGQLQKLYEVILNKKLDKRNFRKSIRKIEELIPLNEKQKNVDHKPAQLFMFRQLNKNIPF